MKGIFGEVVGLIGAVQTSSRLSGMGDRICPQINTEEDSVRR